MAYGFLWAGSWDPIFAREHLGVMGWLDSVTDSTDVNLSKLGDSEGQGSLVCYSPWGRKELDTTQ